MNISEAKLYVGTYRKYNEGSLFGEWLTLSDYDSKDEFLEACKELHSDEEDPEYMFQDYEEMPEALYCESYITPKFWELLAVCEDMDTDTQEAFCDWLDYNGYKLDGDDDLDDLKERFEDALCGYYYESGSLWEPMKNYAYEVAQDLLGIPTESFEVVQNYLDYDAIERDLKVDHYELNGYIFRAA